MQHKSPLVDRARVALLSAYMLLKFKTAWRVLFVVRLHIPRLFSSIETRSNPGLPCAGRTPL